MVLKWIIGLFKVLNSNQNPAEIAAALAFGIWLALIPAGNLMWFFLFFLTFFLKVHQGTEMIVLAVFKLIAPLLDGVLHPLGYLTLTFGPLQPFFTWMAAQPVLPLTGFNQTTVMGGFVAGLILFIPLLLLGLFLVKLFRDRLMASIQNSKLYKAFMNIPLVKSIVQAAGTVSRVVPKLS